MGAPHQQNSAQKSLLARSRESIELPPGGLTSSCSQQCCGNTVICRPCPGQSKACAAKRQQPVICIAHESQCGLSVAIRAEPWVHQSRSAGAVESVALKGARCVQPLEELRPPLAGPALAGLNMHGQNVKKHLLLARDNSCPKRQYPLLTQKPPISVCRQGCSWLHQQEQQDGVTNMAWHNTPSTSGCLAGATNPLASGPS